MLQRMTFDRQFTVFIILLVFTPIATGSTDKVSNQHTWESVADILTIENSVAKCIAVTPVSVTNIGEAVLLTTRVKFQQLTAYCGCKSRLLDYSVTEIHSVAGRDIKMDRIQGIKNTRLVLEKGLNFIIATDTDMIYSGKIVLKLGCHPPD